MASFRNMILVPEAPVSWVTYKRMTRAEKARYYAGLKNAFGVTDSRIAEMMGISRKPLEELNKKLRIDAIRVQESQKDLEAWEEFCRLPYRVEGSQMMPVTEQQWADMVDRALSAERKLKSRATGDDFLQRRMDDVIQRIRCAQQSMRAIEAYAAKLQDPVLPILISDMRNHLDQADKAVSKERENERETI